jgi:hypothetical protein
MYSDNFTFTSMPSALKPLFSDEANRKRKSLHRENIKQYSELKYRLENDRM